MVKERVSPDGERWIDWAIDRCENSAYGKQHGLTGLDSVVEDAAHRKHMEVKVIDRLSIPCRVIENPDYNWDKVWAEIETVLDEIE